MATTSQMEWAPPASPTGAITGWSDLSKAPSNTSKGLLQVDSSLEVPYAVLSEVNAKSAALQTLLRNSQPLLWLDNALVLQREKPSRRFQRQRNQYNVEKLRVDDVDDLDSVFESDLRRRRRVQWEVAKRIARVEREISKQPVGQRSWHVRERQRREEETKRRKEDEMRREKQRREEENASRARAEKRKQSTRQALAAHRHETVEKHTRFRESVDMETAHKAVANHSAPKEAEAKLKFDRSTKATEPTVERVKVVEPTAESSESGDGDGDDNEIVIVASPLKVESSPTVRHEVEMEKTSQPDSLLQIARDSLEDFVPAARTTNARHVADSGEDGKEAAFPRDGRHHDRSGSGITEPRASSLGRQVLSEYRTVPTAVSFGAPPITGPFKERRLNIDVVRRLFSDLDTDRDGHLNRIETSMALHRLQVDVPAPHIVAFFKRIRTLDTSSPTRKSASNGRARTSKSEPLKEVINYKQFVAFVTTAFEQQQLKLRQQSELERDGCDNRHQRQIRRLDIPPVPLPSHFEPTSPSLAPQMVISPAKEPHSSPFRSITTRYQEDIETKYIEQDTDEDLTERILRHIPDHLLTRALSAGASPLLGVQQIVRKSLETMKNSIDDAVVEDVTRDLVQKYAEKLMETRKPRLDDGDLQDVSGLRRAAAFFQSPVEDDAHPQAEQDGDSNGSSDWWSILTEEQIAALVQEIWKQRQFYPREATPRDSEQPEPIVRVQPPHSHSMEARPMVEQQKVSPNDVKKNLDELPTRRIQLVAEKAIQAGSAEWTSMLLAPPPPPPPPLAPPTDEILSIPPPPPEETPLPRQGRSTLARAVLASPEPSLVSMISARQLTTAGKTRTTMVLENMRRHRWRRQQAVAPIARSTESEQSAASSSASAETISGKAILHEESHYRSVGSEFKPETNTERDIEQSNDPVESLSPPLREINLHTAMNPTPSSHIVRSVSSSRSSSDFLSGYASSVSSSINLFRQFERDDVWRYAAQRRRKRLRERRGANRPRTTMARPDESEGLVDASDDLSEGEIPRDSTREILSDGELFGRARRKVVRVKNGQLADGMARIDNTGDYAVQTSDGSLVSGEMLPSMVQLHRRHHQHLIQTSVSSLESGEIEDGAAVV